MPKQIDRHVIDLVKKAYVARADRPSLRQLAEEFCVSTPCLAKYANQENWGAEREASEVKQELSEATVRFARAQKAKPKREHELEMIDAAIADIYAETLAREAKSKEGCARALVDLLKAKRDLFPATVEDLAAMAVRAGIGPSEFVDHLKQQWESQQEQ